MSAIAPPAVKPLRHFVPEVLDVADWSQLEPLYQQLLARPLENFGELDRLLLDFSELTAVIDEYGNRRYIDKSCHTDDADIEKAFLHYVEQIEPKTKPLAFAIKKKVLEAPARSLLRGQRFEMLLRDWQAEVSLFRDENIALETEVIRQVNEYDKHCGAMMVDWDGKSLTLQQAERFLEEPQRAIRERAWRKIAERRQTDCSAFDAIFDKLLPLRQKIAQNAGCGDYRSYIWLEKKRFDYTADDCLRFANAIETTVMPLVRKLDEKRAADLKLDVLRPWDMSVDPLSRPPLRPFDPADIDVFVGKTHSIFKRLSPVLADDFDSLRRLKNLDLESREGKQPGGYQATLAEQNAPFIFMNAAGVQRDVETLLHEAGHAFHTLAAKDEPLVFLRSAPMEFCEVASMAMELLAENHLDAFYDAADADRARRTHLEKIVRLFPWVATIDSFQHWLYTHPNHTGAQRTGAWLDLVERFGSRLDWSGLEEIRAAGWQRQLHLFHVPFYYVEYAIAQLGALQLWIKAQADPRGALASYRAGLALGGTRPLPKLFESAGIHFDFSEKTLQPLMQAVTQALAAAG